MDRLEKGVKKIIEAQKNKKSILEGQYFYPVDISLKNGNILLRAFRIHEIENGKIKGMTWKEEYSAPREDREQIFCYLNFEEISNLTCFDLNIEFSNQ